MARKKDKPWWGKSDTLWGGETFESKDTKPRLAIVSGDVFRVEKAAKKATLIPHPQNVGTWREYHNKKRPIVLTRYRARRLLRAFKMMVMVTKKAKQPKPMLLIERRNGTIAITDNFNNPGAGGGTASVER